MSKLRLAKLSDVATIIMGQSPPSDSYNEEKDGVPFFQGNADFGDITPIVRFYCNKPTKMAQMNDILLSVRAPIGAINISNTNSCIGRGLSAIRVNSDTSYKYLYYVLKNKKKDLIEKGTGSTFKAINKDILNDLMIPIYEYNIQKLIVNILDKSYELINLRKKQTEELDNLIQSAFYDMFGDPFINSRNWKVVRLEKLINIIGGYAFKSSEFVEDGIPVLRIGNINSGKLKTSNLVFYKENESLVKYEIYPYDLVISLTGTVGKDDYANVCILNDTYPKYYLNQRNAKIEIISEVDKYYLSYTLKDLRIKNKLTGISRGVRQANISNYDILNLEIPIPDFMIQNQFAERVKKIEQQKSSLQQSIEQLELNYKSLMQRAFNGTLFE